MIYPLLPNRVWRTYLGGKMLDVIEGKPNPEDSHFPEDWIGSTTRAKNAGREDLPDEGLSKVRLKDGSEKLITEVVSGCPGVLVKFLDSSIRLHVQVHPTVKFARDKLKSQYGKTELWMGVAVREGREGYGYLGFRQRVTKKQWGQLISAQKIDEMLDAMHRVPIEPGDNWLIEAGVPHCIGPDVMMIEAQEPTDWSVRCEFDRGGYILPEAARWMGIGMEQCLDCFDYKPVSLDEAIKRWRLEPRSGREKTNQKSEWICAPANTDRFRVERVTVTGEAKVAVRPLGIHIVTDGEGTVDGWPVKKYDRYIVGDKTTEVVVVPKGTMEIYRVYAPAGA